MKKVYTENDEIEFRLTHYANDYYILEWRFKEPGKFLFFKIYDKWKCLRYYTPGIFTPEDDPSRDFSWYWRGFHMGKKHEVQEYEHILKNIKTKKALFNYYHVNENIERYEKHLAEHNKWLDETNNNIKKYVK